jgi:hypothetical protein
MFLSSLVPAALAVALTASAAQASPILGANPRDQYSAMKQTFQRMYDNGDIHPRIERIGGKVELVDCTNGSSYLGSDSFDDSTYQIANLAYEVVRLRRLFSALGYPERVWQPLLTEFEQGQMRWALQKGKSSGGWEIPPEQRHAEAYQKKFQAALNRYRQESAPRLPAVTIEGGCGEGEVGVKIRTEPRNGRVVFIPVFFHELCKTRGINPDDPGRCDRWREPAEGVLFNVAGDYFYRATWPDGTLRRGRLSFTNLKEGQTVTLSKP